MPIIEHAYDAVLLPFTKNAIGNKMVIGAHVLIVSVMAMLAISSVLVPYRVKAVLSIL